MAGFNRCEYRKTDQARRRLQYSGLRWEGQLAHLRGGGAMTNVLPRRSLIMALSILMLLTGCEYSAGPAYLRIETGGERYDDFVLEPVQEYGRIHSSEMVVMDGVIVASEEDLTLPEFPVGWTFSTLLVSAYHPEFAYSWTGQADSSSDELILSPIRPQHWEDFLEERGEVSFSVIWNHLEHMRISYVPAFDTGEARERLQRYVPGLLELIQKASWVSGDSRRWATEDEARANLEEMLQAIADLMAGLVQY